MQNEMTRLYNQAKIHLKKSPATMIARGLDKLGVYAYSPIAKVQLGKKQFSCFGAHFPYYTHPYNATWRNERAVEIPIALQFLNQNRGKRILELGNVTDYYQARYDVKTHVVVDKYEASPSVLNLDFISYKPEVSFDAFLSISTFEHIGWDEPTKDQKKVELALQHIQSVVTNKENVLVSFPLGYHPHLDHLVQTHQHGFKNVSCLIRVNQKNEWQEVSINDALGRPYGGKFRAANALFVGRGLI